MFIFMVAPPQKKTVADGIGFPVSENNAVSLARIRTIVLTCKNKVSLVVHKAVGNVGPVPLPSLPNGEIFKQHVQAEGTG